MTQAQDGKEFKEFFEKGMYILRFSTISIKMDIFKVVKGWMKESWIEGRRLLKEKEAKNQLVLPNGCLPRPE